MLSCNAQTKKPVLLINKDDNTLLWQISGNGLQKPSYLFGTFHLMCKNDIQFSNQLKAALANSASIYMELDMDDPSLMLSGMMLMTMKGGKKLSDFYSTEEYKKIETFFKDSLGTPLSFLQTMKPFMLLALLYPKMMPCKTVSGVEEELMKLAKSQKKEIKGLETMELQAAVFDSIPYEEQAKELLKSIDSMAMNKRNFDTMMRVYKSQRLSAIEALFSKSEFGMQDHEDILLNKRNINWVEQLGTILQKENVFIAVGAGHLVGENGLITLLRKKGFNS
jgi:hypothetical protein